jgi:uncharacterized protein YlxW (UPF0749 family)
LLWKIGLTILRINFKSFERRRATVFKDWKPSWKDTKSLNKRDARREKEVTDLQVDVEELAERVQILEQKAA